MTNVRYREGTFELRCATCREWWPLSLDSWQPANGLRRCRACWREYQRAWEARRRGQPEVVTGIRAAQRAKYHANRAVRLAASRRWREANRERKAAYQREWRARRKAA